MELSMEGLDADREGRIERPDWQGRAREGGGCRVIGSWTHSPGVRRSAVLCIDVPVGIAMMLLVLGSAFAVVNTRAQVQPDLTETLTQEEPGGDDEVVEAVPDTALANRLRTIFANIDEFSGVQVSVTEGVVRLGGTVDQPESRRGAEELASSLDGVVYVVNEIEASTDVETRITPAVAQIQEYWNGFVAQLPVLAVALLIVLLFAAVSFLISRWKKPSAWRSVNPLVWNFVNRLVRGILVLVGLVLAFDILGIASLMGAVLGTAGIVGLALGFAFQDIVENYLAGMLLSLRRPFGVNDLVRVGDFEGRVIRLTSREVVLLTFEGNHVRLPNAHVFKNPLTNFTINPKRLFAFDVGVGVQEDLQEAIRVGIRTLEAMRGVIDDPPPFARVQQIGDWSVIVRFHGWVDQREADFLKVQSEAIRLVKAALDEAEIELPEPIYRVLTRPLDAAAKPSKRPAGPLNEAIDVSPDNKLDEQVREDLQRSQDENLLE